MMAAPDERLKALRRLLFLAAVMGLGYLCTRTLRFTNDFLNIAFVCSFFLIPFLAAREALRPGGWLKIVTTILLVPLLALSMVSLLLTVSCYLPDAMGHVERSRELAWVQQGNYQSIFSGTKPPEERLARMVFSWNNACPLCRAYIW